MQIIKEKYAVEETLNKRVKNILMFLNLSNDVYINSLENKMPFNELQSFIKAQIN